MAYFYKDVSKEHLILYWLQYGFAEGQYAAIHISLKEKKMSKKNVVLYAWRRSLQTPGMQHKKLITLDVETKLIVTDAI